jgi:hypothetical protein
LFGPTSQPSANPPERFPRPHWGWFVVVGLAAFTLAAAAVESAMHFDSYAMDGPFQLFNALRRISVGQRIGDTFQFFHGPGIPYFFFPGFAAGGSTFTAAEVSRQLINVALFLASTLVMARALVSDWRKAMPIALAALIVMVEFRLDALIYPLNSLLGVRSTMPVFVAAHLLMRTPGRRADLERGALVGLALLLGTEQGIASIAALAIARAAVGVRRNALRSESVHFVVEAGVGLACFLGLVGILAGSNTLSVLRFNFREVPQDQQWYFGAPPNAFLSQWSEILPMMAQRPRWWVTIVAGILIAAHSLWRSPQSPDERRPTANLFLVLYGLISLTSMLGIFIPAYAQPATRATLFVVLGWMWVSWNRYHEELPGGLRSIAPALPIMGLIAVALVTFLRERDAVAGLLRAPMHVIRDHILGSERARLSDVWIESDITGLAEVQKARTSLGRTPVIWSTYAGLLEWQAGVFHPETDYIIHTLGPARRAAYAKAFVATRPDLVQTIRPGYIWYEEWLEGAHWDFYRPLIERYDVSARGPWSFFWRPSVEPRAQQASVLIDMPVPAGAATISAPTQLPPDSVGLFEVRVRYRTHNLLGAVPILGGLPRFLLDLPGSADQYPISLAPYATERSFPVVIRGGLPIIVRARVASLVGGASVTLDSVRIERIPVSRTNMLWMNDYVTRNYLQR